MSVSARAARAIAVAVAILGVIDPAIATSRRTPATIAVVATLRDGRSAAVVDAVAGALDRDYQVVRGRTAGAAATVLVGDRLPEGAARIPGLGFVARPGDDVQLIVTHVDAPARVRVGSRVPVRVHLDAIGLDGRTVAVALRRHGVTLDRIERRIGGRRAEVDVELTFVSATPEVAALQVEATTPDVAPARADLAVDAVRDRARVLFFDGRPSWLSTFVRREIERDERFDVSHRTRTSRGIGAATAGAPGALSSIGTLTGFQAIVASAPEALPGADLAGLEAFARRRGGSVILLLDADPGAALAPMLGIDRWQLAMLPQAEGVDLSPIGLDRVFAAELILPAGLPPRARAIAHASAERRPVLFEAPIGAGRVIVSGLSDVWRHRMSGANAPFASMWRSIVDGAAGAALPPVEVTLSRSAAAPGDAVDVSFALRDLLLALPGSSMRARLEAELIDPAGGAAVVRLWPDGAPGLFRGSFPAPDTPGVHRLRVSAADVTADAVLAVVADARRAQADESDLLAAWAATRGGAVFDAGAVAGLRAALDAALPEARADVRVHVMRSGWWIVPFALALGIEWWSRRRQGRR